MGKSKIFSIMYDTTIIYDEVIKSNFNEKM